MPTSSGAEEENDRQNLPTSTEAPHPRTKKQKTIYRPRRTTDVTPTFTYSMDFASIAMIAAIRGNYELNNNKEQIIKDENIILSFDQAKEAG